MKNGEEADIVTSDEKEMNAKKKQEHAKGIKKIWDVTLRESDRRSGREMTNEDNQGIPTQMRYLPTKRQK